YIRMGAMKINLEVIKGLAKNINEHELTEVCLESNDVKIIMKKEKKNEAMVKSSVSYVPMEEVNSSASQLSEKNNYEEEKILESINSPMIGSFYSASGPGAEVFVKEGQEIKKGTTVCIIEAMKLMNEVKAIRDCKIEKILVSDGTVIKKGEKIFLIS
ncbi:MAG: acetyl-CoA carboxylase biotin carboxyl carrier protein, partial [Fusobacteriaceae bacterium]